MRGRINEINQAEAGNTCSLLLEKRVNVLPGQYFKLRFPQRDDILSATVFPTYAEGQQLQVMPLAAFHWMPGEEVHLHGPFGKGFGLPEARSRVGIYVPAGASALAALPLLEEALKVDHEVTLVSDSFLAGLLAEVEVLPLSHADEVLAWADYLAAVSRLEELSDVVSKLLPKRQRLNRPSPDELLVLAEMPCAGVGQCEMCLVPSKNGWKHACKEGPVFKLAALGGA